MTEVRIAHARRPGELATARRLILEYAATLPFDLGFQDFAAELESLERVYAPPRGCLLLAWIDREAAGCVALRPLDEQTAELKRLYVRPARRGLGLGLALTRRALAAARRRGYRRVRLDTVPGMDAAIALYRALPVPGALYMELEIGRAASSARRLRPSTGSAEG